MSNTHTERPGTLPRQTRNPSPHTSQSLATPAARVPWEITFISLLAVHLEQRDARIAYFEAEDARKAEEIDRLNRAFSERRRAA